LARADFGSAWQVFLSKLTEADFQKCSCGEASSPMLRLTAAAVAEPISQSPNSAGGRKYGASEKSGALLFVKEPLPIPCLNSRSFGLLGVGDALELEPVDRADT